MRQASSTLIVIFFRLHTITMIFFLDHWTSTWLNWKKLARKCFSLCMWWNEMFIMTDCGMCRVITPNTEVISIKRVCYTGKKCEIFYFRKNRSATYSCIIFWHRKELTQVCICCYHDNSIKSDNKRKGSLFIVCCSHKLDDYITVIVASDNWYK